MNRPNLSSIDLFGVYDIDLGVHLAKYIYHWTTKWKSTFHPLPPWFALPLGKCREHSPKTCHHYIIV